ncbi:MAG: serine/threonine-protein kinase, partial [Bacteroidota bacterium]
MIKGQIIGDYKILQDFTTAGGGQSKWTFAEKDGKQYFIKEFLHPTYPSTASPGSEAVKAKKLAVCDAFERQFRKRIDLLSPFAVPGGNLVHTVDFFRFGSRYYKVTEKITAISDPQEVLVNRPLRERLIVLTALTHTLRILHSQGIVHGD